MTFQELWDWRRRVSELYAAVRAQADAQAGWQLWRAGRDQLYRSHPQTPLEAEARARFEGLPFFPYDPGLRFLVRLAPIEAGPEETFETGADGTVAMRPFARTDGLQARLGRELTLYWL